MLHIVVQEKKKSTAFSEVEGHNNSSKINYVVLGILTYK